MASIFIDLFNMSITASYLVLAVVVARLLLKKAPKWINCLLWALVGIRLICPFSFESSLSLVPSSQTISINNSSAGRPFTVQSGVPVVDSNINEIIGDKYYEGVTVPTNTFADMTTILSIVWLVCLFAMLLYGSISYLRVHKKVDASILFTDNIYYCDNIDTPFIFGLIKPKIYVPSGISEEQIGYIALHEKAHLKRKDHFWKPLGFILLSVYWFNPVMWIAYILLCRDIEIACDEKVIKNMPNTEKKSYSETLVSCSVQRRMVMACPLAFGEVGVKQRIKSVLNYKKPAFWVIVFSILLIAVVAICFLTNPDDNSSSIGIIGGADGPTSIIVSDKNTKKEIKKLQEKYPHFFNLDDSDGLTVYVTALGADNYRWYLSSNKTPVDPQKIMSFSEFSQTDETPLILSVYNINDEDIEVVPFQHKLSSFLWEKGEQDAEYLRRLVGLASMYDTALKTFNATVVDIAPQGIVVEPFENEAEWNEEFNEIFIWNMFSCVVNEKVRVVYDGRVRNDLSMFPQNIVSAIAVYSITDEKESSKRVNVNIDKNLLLNNTVIGYRFDEETFLKEMKEYEARVIQANDGTKYSVAFSESQFNKYLTDKYNQVSAYYNSFKDDDDEYAVIKKVEFDENFRNLKIYINKELWEVMAYDCTEGVASQAYAYQMFLEDGIGVNVEVINNKTNNVYNSYTLPYKH